MDEVLGSSPELETFKRSSDKLDLLLTLGLTTAGVTLFRWCTLQAGTASTL